MKKYYVILLALLVAVLLSIGCSNVSGPDNEKEFDPSKSGRGLAAEAEYACHTEIIVMADEREDLAALEKDYEEVGIEMIEFPNPTVPEEGTDIHFDQTGTNFVPMTKDDILKGYSGNNCGFVYSVEVNWDSNEEEYLINIEVRCDDKDKADDLMNLYESNGWTQL